MAEDVEAPETRTVTFRGRDMQMKWVNFGQVVAMQELGNVTDDAHLRYLALKEQADAATDPTEAEALRAQAREYGKKVFKQGSRLVLVFKGLMTEDDHEWLIDRMAEGQVDEDGMQELLLALVEAWGNRQQRRAPAKKARRAAKPRT
jgi:hypothetical protein